MIKSALTEIRIFDFWVITKVYIIMCLKFLHKNWDSPANPLGIPKLKFWLSLLIPKLFFYPLEKLRMFKKSIDFLNIPFCFIYRDTLLRQDTHRRSSPSSEAWFLIRSLCVLILPKTKSCLCN